MAQRPIPRPGLPVAARPRLRAAVPCRGGGADAAARHAPGAPEPDHDRP